MKNVKIPNASGLTRMPDLTEIAAEDGVNDSNSRTPGWAERLRAGEARVVDAANNSATAMYYRALIEGRNEQQARDTAIAVLTIVGIAAERAAAKAAGYESWTEFEMDQVVRLIQDIA